MKYKILLIEDEERLCRILRLVLSDNGYQVKTATDGAKGIDIWQEWHPDVVVSDLKMQPVGGQAVMNFGRINFPKVPIIILTAFGSISTAVAAMKNGVFDFLTKPVDHNRLLDVISESLNLADIRKDRSAIDSLVGASSEMEKIKRDIRLFASSDSSVLISGESGTGKEIVVRAIHEASARRNGPFIKVNCAAIPGELIESELFGHKKGAFTGAMNDRKGAFVLADQGTLFLDEIGDLPLELQPKLLHAVEEKIVVPVGSAQPVPVSVKILSATNRNLHGMIKVSKFREDLFYRLNTVCIYLPSLKDRGGDIKELALFFLERYCREFEKPVLKISKEAMRALERYSWPGNVRELKNIMERLALTCQKTVIELKDLPEMISEETALPDGGGPETVCLDMASHEQYLLNAALEKCGWNQSNAARMLGITRSALRYRLQKYGVEKISRFL